MTGGRALGRTPPGPAKLMSKNLVIIPAYNEEDTIEEVVRRSLRHADVSVTDDGSRDRTPEILRNLAKETSSNGSANKLHVITHEKSTHIPQGLQDGLRFGMENGYEFFVTMDAGLSHDPDVLPEFFGQDPSWDVVIGRRANKARVPVYRKIISYSAAHVVNYALTPSFFNFRGLGLKDCTSGFRRYSRRAARCIAEAELQSRSFDFHMEALGLAVRGGMSATEIPISYVFSNSSFNRKVLKDALRYAWILLKHKNGKNESGKNENGRRFRGADS